MASALPKFGLPRDTDWPLIKSIRKCVWFAGNIPYLDLCNYICLCLSVCVSALAELCGTLNEINSQQAPLFTLGVILVFVFCLFSKKKDIYTPTPKTPQKTALVP